MKLYLIDRMPSSDRLAVEELKQRLTESHITFDTLDADSRDAQAKNEIYDIVSFPAILITQDDGTLIRLWQRGIPTTADIANNLAS